jgi:hypothetical protein
MDRTIDDLEQYAQEQLSKELEADLVADGRKIRAEDGMDEEETSHDGSDEAGKYRRL